jgi:ABC-2 type transport system permease protein
LIRLILRRDRVRLPIWTLVLAGFPIFTASALVELYATEASRVGLAATVGSNPAFVAMLGPIYEPTIGGLTAWRIGTVGALLIGIMAVLGVVRHTRDEEESGRRELLGATVVGRHAPLTAAVLVMTGTGLLIGILTAAGLIGVGLPTAGSVAYGLGFIAVALAFSGLGALAAQLTHGGGSARGIGVGMVGLAFMLRAAADAGEIDILGWLSPIGWFTRLRPYAGDRWPVLFFSLGLGMITVIAAYVIAARRDLGAGALPGRVGPAEAGPGLRTPLGLAWRLQRRGLFGWTVGVALVSALYGSIANSVDDLLADNPQMGEVLQGVMGDAQDLRDAFFSFAAGILALIASAYSIGTALTLRGEEEDLRAESVLATATSRSGWAASHLLFALTGPALMLSVGGVVMGTIYGSAVGDISGQLPRVLASSLVQLAPVWVITGTALFLFGALPRFTALAWAVLVGCLLFGQLGQILQFPQWLLNISPFTHVAEPSVSDIGALPIVVLVAVAAVLIGAGFASFRRRDVPAV